MTADDSGKPRSFILCEGRMLTNHELAIFVNDGDCCCGRLSTAVSNF